nr:hypothetical protein [Tanacetum cinerariifolium]
MGTVRFGNDQFAPILSYGDLVQGNVTINMVYYVEGLNHNLFSVGQFDLYKISLQESTSSTPLCLMAKATPTQAWLWHRRLSHLNFDYINLLSKKDIVIGLPKLKYVKDQLCSSCKLSKAKRSSFKSNAVPSSKGRLNLLHMDLCGPMRVASINGKKYILDQLCSSCKLSKAKRSSFKSKAVPSSKGRLNLLHMDLCGPMRVASINGKKYILVIIDDYSRYTWTLFLRSKDETPEVLKDFLTMIQRNLQAPMIIVRTDRGTEFLNKTLNAFFKEEGIEHQTSTARTPEQNSVVERRNPDADVPSQQELDLLFGPLYDEFFNAGSNPSTNIQSTSAPSTHTNMHAEENNNDQAEEGEKLQDDGFTNPLCAPTQEVAESSSHNVGNLNIPTFNQPQVSEYRWMKDHPLEQVRKNPSRPLQTRRQLATDLEMCMYALTVSTAEPKNIKEAMADSAWIEAMQEELHQFDRLQLRKALYGLKQAPRAWYDELLKFLTSKGFTKGLQIHQSPSGIFINQAKYTLEILYKHGMDKGQSIGTPMATKPKLDTDLSGNPVDQTDYRSKIGSLMYLTSSRPDIVQAVCFCARYQSRPTEKHLKEVKRVFKYLRGTVNMGLWYPKDSSFELTVFSDADHAGCIDSRKSTSGGIQFLGDKLVSWMSKKQNCIAMSLAEAEYVALSKSCAQVMWMRTQLQDYGFNYNKISLYSDSQSAIAISCNPVQHSHTKHIHTQYHFIKKQVENSIIELYFVRTEYQLADMFTKALPDDRFKYLVRRIGMRCLTPAELE